MLMRVAEKYAASLGIQRIRLYPDPPARLFYTKVGYNTNSNNEEFKVKYLFGAPKRPAKRAPNVARNEKNARKKPKRAASPASGNRATSRSSNS